MTITGKAKLKRVRKWLMIHPSTHCRMILKMH